MFDSEFSPQTGAKSGKVKTEYKQDLVTIAADMDLNMAGPVVNASAVVGHQGWLGGNFDKKKILIFFCRNKNSVVFEITWPKNFFPGYQMAFDTSKSQLTKNNFAIGYASGDFTLHTNVNDGQVSFYFISLNCLIMCLMNAIIAKLYNLIFFLYRFLEDLFTKK